MAKRIKDEEQFMQHYKEYMAPECRAQLPAFNRVGRGLKGDAADVTVETDENGHIIMTGSHIDAYDGSATQNFQIDLTNTLPQLGFRLIEHYRFKDRLNPTVVEKGWIIHFRYKVIETNQIMWEFDTPFIKMSEFPGTQLPEDRILDGSY